MLKLLVVLIAAAVGIVLVFAATRPDTIRVARTATIKAPPEKVFALVNDLTAWMAWSPYEKKDPDMKRTHSGPAAGKGARYAWAGNKDIGEGSMEITQATPSSKIVMRLDFVKPFEAHNTVEFTFEPEGDSTRVTWLMHGPAAYLSKVMGIFIDMDEMIGKDFAAGLASLKARAEAAAR